MRTGNARPYNKERRPLASVGTGVPDGPAAIPFISTLGFGNTELRSVRADDIRPYSLERTSLEYVGAIINRPAAIPFVSTLGFGKIELRSVYAGNARSHVDTFFQHFFTSFLDFARYNGCILPCKETCLC